MSAVFLILAISNEPQATAVELAQLGGGGLLRGTSWPPLTNVLIRYY